MVTSLNTAKGRAEELLQNLQKKARELLEAEEGLVHTVRALVEERGFAPAEVKKKLDELVGALKANKVWERVKQSDAVVVLNDYRGEVERKVEESVQKLLANLPVATKADVTELSAQVNALSAKVVALAEKLQK